MESDERFLWLEARIRSLLSPDSSHIKQLVVEEHNRRSINQFLANPEIHSLYVHYNAHSNGLKTLTVTVTPPAKVQSQSVIFFKPRRVVITEDNIHDEAMFINCGNVVLEHLYLLTSEVFLTLLCNVNNQDGWSSVADLLLDSYHRLLESTYVVIGKTKGKTLLPLPPSNLLSQLSVERGVAVKDKEKVHILESVVVAWTKQIKDVLKAEPDGSRKRSAIGEIRFWQTKLENLDSIHTQLVDSNVSKVIKLLDYTKSSFVHSLHRVIKEVGQACLEARDNVHYLLPLKPFFEKLAANNSDFNELSEIFWPLMHTLLLVWDQSRYYQNQSRLVELLKQICNDLISRARETIDGTTIFRIDPSDAYTKLRNVLKVCAVLRGSYHDYKFKADTLLYRRMEASNQKDGTNVVDVTNVVGTSGPISEEDSNANNNIESEKGGVNSTAAHIIGNISSMNSKRSGMDPLPSAWPTRNSSAFHRLDTFLERCHDVLDLAQTALAFKHLEHIEIGGVCGKHTTTLLVHIHAEFSDTLSKFIEKPCDALDVDSVSSFDDEFYRVRVLVKMLERRLSNVVAQSFDNCDSVESALKLLEAFDGLTDRDLIRQKLEPKYLWLLVRFRQEVETVSGVFDSEKSDPPMSRNLPPMAGAMMWVRGLLERITTPMARVKSTLRSLLDTEDGRELTSAYVALVRRLTKFQDDTQASWVADMESTTQIMFKQHLLKYKDQTSSAAADSNDGALIMPRPEIVVPGQSPSSVRSTSRDSARSIPLRFVEVNYDPSVVRIESEVHYMLQLNFPVPPNAIAIYEKSKHFHQYARSLVLVIKTYNKMIEQLTYIEMPLFLHVLKEIDTLLQLGLTQLSWKSYGLGDYVNDISVLVVKDTMSKLRIIKDNMTEIKRICKHWSTISGGVFARRDVNKTYELKELQAQNEYLMDIHHHEVTESGREIQRLLQSSNRVLKISKGAPVWKCYLDHVCVIVRDALVAAALGGLQCLRNQIDATYLEQSDMAPLLEIKLQIVVPIVIFNPPLDETGGNGSVKEIVFEWLSKILKISDLVSGLDNEHEDFHDAVCSDPDVIIAIEDICNIVNDNQELCQNYSTFFESTYSHLWTKDISESFQSFMSQSQQTAKHGQTGSPRKHSMFPVKLGPRAENNDQLNNWLNPGPSLEQFDEHISIYRTCQDTISRLPTSGTAGWIRINCVPIKQALNTWAAKWINYFSQHLMEQTCLAIQDLRDFIERVEGSVAVTLPESADVTSCLQVMYDCHEMRSKQDIINRMYEPLRRSIALLRKYGFSLPSEPYEFFSAALPRWIALKKTVHVVHERLGPLMQQEAEHIMEQLGDFAEEVRNFRQEFYSKAPFSRACNYDEVLTTLSLYDENCQAIYKKANGLKELEELVEFQAPTGYIADVKQCSLDIDMLRRVWGVKNVVHQGLSEWLDQAWIKVDTDPLSAATKDYLKDIEALPPESFEWDVVVGLLEEITSIIESLPLIHKLRSHPLRERHWKHLTRNTGIAAVKINDNTTLEYLFSLGLHHFADDVHAIVERAKAEMELERTLDKIGESWVSRTLQFVVYRRGVPVALSPRALASQGFVSSENVTGVAAVSSSDVVPEVPNSSSVAALSAAALETSTQHAASTQNLSETVNNNATINEETYSLASSSVILSAVEENQAQLQMMLYSKNITSFLDDVKLWLRRLETVESVLMLWLEIQGSWSEMEHIFTSGSPVSQELRRELPQEAMLFNQLDRELRTVVKIARTQPNVVQACCRDGLVSTMERIQVNIEHCERVLMRFLSRKCKIYPRFFFLAPRQLMHILCLDTCPHVVVRYIQLVFTSVRDVITKAFVVAPTQATSENVEDGDSGPIPPGSAIEVPPGSTNNTFNDSIMATGLRSIDGEILDFVNPLTLVGSCEIWLAQILSSTKEALKSSFETALLDESQNDIVSLVNKFNFQVLLLALQTSFDRSVESILQNGGGSSLDAKGKEIQASFERVLALDISSHKVEAVIATLVHQRDLIDCIRADSTPSPSSYVWQSQLRYSMDSDGTMLIQLALSTLPYGWEYVGSSPRLFSLPSTESCRVSIARTLSSAMGACIVGKSASGKTESVRDLATLAGKPIYMVDCTPMLQYDMVNTLLIGMATTGAWMCLDDLNHLKASVLSVLAQQICRLFTAIQIGSGDIPLSDGRETLPLDNSCALFSTMTMPFATTMCDTERELPPNLKQYFRSISILPPDLVVLSELSLFVGGFVNAPTLARALVRFFELTDGLLSHECSCDWGVRTLKPVLRVAATLRRTSPDVNMETMHVVHAVLDVIEANVTHSLRSGLLTLLHDAFPDVNYDDVVITAENASAPTTVAIESAVKDRCLVSASRFEQKVASLSKLVDMRHAVFLIGPSGVGKTECLRTYECALKIMGWSVQTVTASPKAVEPHDLFGYMHPQAGHWKNGLLAALLRPFSANVEDQVPGRTMRLVHLDGEIDPLWMDHMSSVLDGTRNLMLANAEAITLSASTRFIFEASSLKFATPSTISLGALLVMDKDDVGIQPLISRWLRKRVPNEREVLEPLFTRYVMQSLQYVAHLKHVVVMADVGMVDTLLWLLDGLFLQAKRPLSTYGTYFNFAALWAFGGALEKADMSIFSKWWLNEFSDINYPHEESPFDCFVDPDTHTMISWNHNVRSFAPSSSSTDVFVPTVVTECMSHLLGLLIDAGKHVMFVGASGAGKSASMADKQRIAAAADEMINATISVNSLVTGNALRRVIDENTRRHNGRHYWPPFTKKLLVMIDDLNMGSIDKYGEMSLSSLLRQQLDHGGYYDLDTLEWKCVNGVLIMATIVPSVIYGMHAMPRLQRHFATFSCAYPTNADLHSMLYAKFVSSLQEHVAGMTDTLNDITINMVSRLVQATVEIQSRVLNKFLPTPEKCHYQFNIRDLSVVFEGIMLWDKSLILQETEVFRLWVHECEAVYCDRLVTTVDIREFREIMLHVSKRYFENVPHNSLLSDPFIFHALKFSTNPRSGQRELTPVQNYSVLRGMMEVKLYEYNEHYPRMDLIMFEDVLRHVNRLTRVLLFPYIGGNALLVGSGGSGKQTLARLAAFICGYDVFQTSSSPAYGLAEFKTDLVSLYFKAGVKGQRTVFLLTESQIVNEQFLVYINDFLSSGSIPNLFTAEERNNINNSIQSEVKQAGLLYKKDVAWMYFIRKVRQNMRMVICMSSDSDSFTDRCRRFPALVQNTSVVWFQPWSKDALVGVALEHLRATSPDLDEDILENVAHHMAFVHLSVRDFKKPGFRSFTMATQKLYFEMIKRFIEVLKSKKLELATRHLALSRALSCINATTREASRLEAKLNLEGVVLEEKDNATHKLLSQIGQDMVMIEEQTAFITMEQEVIRDLESVVLQYKAAIQVENDNSKPILDNCRNILGLLTKAHCQRIRSVVEPEPIVRDVMTAAILMCESSKTKPDITWALIRKFLSNFESFIDTLCNFNVDSLTEANVVSIEALLSIDEFDSEKLSRTGHYGVSIVAGWVRSMFEYYSWWLKTIPLREGIELGLNRLNFRRSKLDQTRLKVEELDSRVQNLCENFKQAAGDKSKQQALCHATQEQLMRARRLIQVLADEKVRWGITLKDVERCGRTLVGDVAVAVAYATYMGGFELDSRQAILSDMWQVDLIERGISSSLVEESDQEYGLGSDEESLDSDYVRTSESNSRENSGYRQRMRLSVIATAQTVASCKNVVNLVNVMLSNSTLAEWSMHGLPMDTIAVENGVLISTSRRWSLLVDPHQQGVEWIKKLEGEENLMICSYGQTHPPYLSVLETAVKCGYALLIRYMPDKISSVLHSVITQSNTARKSMSVQSINIGTKEVEYHPNFRLYLTTDLTNPNYSPEDASATNIIDFMLTQERLTEILVQRIFTKEMPTAVDELMSAVNQQNTLQIKQGELQDRLLKLLAIGDGDIPAETELIERLVEEQRVIDKQITDAKIVEAEHCRIRDQFTAVATRGSSLFFVLDSMSKVHPCYQFVIDDFLFVFDEALRSVQAEFANVEGDTMNEKRTEKLLDTVNGAIFRFGNATLFQEHRLLFVFRLCLAVCEESGNVYTPEEITFFLEKNDLSSITFAPVSAPPVDWLPAHLWSNAQRLPGDALKSLVLPSIGPSWRQWYGSDSPEHEKTPLGDDINEFQFLLIIKCLRPDRLAAACGRFAMSVLGNTISMQSEAFDLFNIISSLPTQKPVYLPIIHHGQSASQCVQDLAKSSGIPASRLRHIPMGNSASIRMAEVALTIAIKEGGWVYLENVHLVPKWLPILEKRAIALVDMLPDFRLIYSAVPSSILPISLLRVSRQLLPIECSQGIPRTLSTAWSVLNSLKGCQGSEYQQALFSLCQLHTLIIERDRVGCCGWTRDYDFNMNDLVHGHCILVDIMAGGTQVPWKDLRCRISGNVYSARMSEVWDRRICDTYIDELLVPGSSKIVGVPVPPILEDAEKTYNYMVEQLGGVRSLYDTPLTVFGFHSNQQSDASKREACELIHGLSTMITSNVQHASPIGRDLSRRETIKQLVDSILEAVADFPKLVINEENADNCLFVTVRNFECKRMNTLLDVMRESLELLDTCLHGDSFMTHELLQLHDELLCQSVPLQWAQAAYPSERTLSSWLSDLSLRVEQLYKPTLPRIVWLSGLFNPSSYLVACKHYFAKKNSWPLHEVRLITDIVDETVNDDDIFITGFSLEGATWDGNSLAVPEGIEQYHTRMPVMRVRSVLEKDFDSSGYFAVPVYATRTRKNFIFEVYLRSSCENVIWILAGTALLLDDSESLITMLKH